MLIEAPATHFENDDFDYAVKEKYQCSHCADTCSKGIYFDHLVNGNICSPCLNNTDTQFVLGMDDKEYQKYTYKVIQQKPINPL